MKELYMAKEVIELEGKGSYKEIMFHTALNPIITEANGTAYGNEDFTIQIWEGVETSNDGISLNIGYSLNRILDNSHRMGIYESPTVTNYGIKLWEFRTWVTRETTGIAENHNYQIVVRPDTKYIWKIIKNNNGKHFIDINFWWNEG